MTAQSPTLEATRTRRRAGVTLRLTTAAGSALLAAVACAGAGVVGLHSVSSRNHELSSIAVTLKDVAELRDAEGDMRVTVHVIGSATGADLTDALAEAHDEDVRADAAIDVLRKDLAGHDADLNDLQAFVAGLQKWRTIRDGQIATAAARGDADSAQAVIDGPLSAADDAFAEPLDHMVEHVSAEVQPAREAGDSAVGRSTLAVALALALGLALATVLSVLTIRGIVRPCAGS